MTAQMTLPFGKSRFHAALYTNSPRLQRVLKLLADGEWYTSFEIAMRAGVVNPSGAISELKAPINGMDIQTDYVGELNGRKIWRYRWIRK